MEPARRTNDAPLVTCAAATAATRILHSSNHLIQIKDKLQVLNNKFFERTWWSLTIEVLGTMKYLRNII
jgi:hypothetical protein